MQSNRRVAANSDALNITRTTPYLKPARGLKIAHVGTYPPRKCGIATYTQDVVSAVHAATPAAPPQVVAMTTPDDTVEYGWPVQWRIRQDDPEDYEAVAAQVRASGADLVSIQHEHGIFGGEEGDLLNRFVDALGDIPVVTTLHTVLPKPSESIIRALRGVVRRSARIVVLNSKAIPLLADAYGIDTAKVVVIPHGTPEVDPSRRTVVRQSLGVAGRTVLSTFGLLSPGKGLEHAIGAVAQVAPRHPDLHYYILGATHPGIVRHSGESYRDGLAEQARQAGIADRVHFVNEYLSLDALTDWLLATDVYVTPYLNPDQIVSGTLAYAVAAGKAVISTPYLHAQDLLEDGRGMLTPFADPAALAANLDDLLRSPARRAAMEQAAWRFGEQSAWPQVARRYWEVFCAAVGRSAGEAPVVTSGRNRMERSGAVSNNGTAAAAVRASMTESGLLERAAQEDEELECSVAPPPPAAQQRESHRRNASGGSTTPTRPDRR